jgi:hypothetical protein
MSVSTVWRRSVLSVIRRNCCLQLQDWSMCTYWFHCSWMKRRNIVVGIETRLRNVPAGTKFSVFSKTSRPALKRPCCLFHVQCYFFPLRKAAGWWSWLLTSVYCRGSRRDPFLIPPYAFKISHGQSFLTFRSQKIVFNGRWGLNKECPPNMLLLYCCTSRPGWRFATDWTVRSSNSARSDILRTHPDGRRGLLSLL